jgi:putative transposase
MDRMGAHTNHDLKVHLVSIPKYRKKILMGAVAVLVRDLIRQIAMEHDLQTLSGKMSRDHIHVFNCYHHANTLAE